MGRRKRARKWNGQTDSGRRADGGRACRKRGYDTEEEALRVLRRIRQSADRRKAELERLPIHVRECESCGAFHITGAISKPVKGGKLRRRRQGGMGWK